MKKLALTTLILGLFLVAPSAFAQCPPGSWLCADITIGGSVSTTPPPVVQQPVVVQPLPPPVVVVPARPRVIVAPAPPPVVVYQPSQVIVQARPQPQYVLPPPTRAPYAPPPQRYSWLGVSLNLSGAFLGTPADRTSPSFMGGLGVGLRWRTRGHFGGELAGGTYHGHDFNGDLRTEVPVTGSVLFYANPQNAFQVYFLGGLGLSAARVWYNADHRAAHGGEWDASYVHFGGQLGAGFEWQLTPRFSLFADARVFLRTRIDDRASANPEFARNLASGTTQTTNTSAGLLTSVGGIFYF